MKVLAIILIFVVASLIMPDSELYAEKSIEPVIKFDKSEYGPRDLVYIEIIYPPANTDPEVQDTLEARISTSSGTAQSRVFYEAKPGFTYGWYQYEHQTDSGIFYSYVYLTLDPPEWEGVLQVQKDDYLSVEFKTKEGMTFTKKVDINFNLGHVRFNKDAFLSKEHAEISVWDLDRNSNPDRINTLPVFVRSTTDPMGIMVTLKETNTNSSEFLGFMAFTKNEKSSGTRLLVTSGDTITARYIDNTRLPTDQLSPKGFKTFAVREVFSSALIGDCLCPPMERAYTSELMLFSPTDKVPRVLAYYDQLKTGDTAIIRTEITNAQNMNTPFAYLVQIKYDDQITVSLSWIRGELKANETMKVESTWIPEASGTYTMESFVWSDIDNPDPLSPTRTTEVKVE